MVVDKQQELNNVVVVRITGESEIKELSGIVSGDHLWLNSVNQCRFVAHVPLDDEQTQVVVLPIKGSLVECLRDHSAKSSKRVSAVFDTVSPTGKNDEQRWCALIF